MSQLDISDKTLRDVFAANLDERRIDFTGEERGAHSVAKIVRGEHGMYVVKIPQWSVKITRELFAYEHLHGMVPMPRPFYSDDRIIIQEYIEGERLSDAVLDGRTKRAIFNELGSLTRKIHSIHMAGGGLVEQGGRAAFPSFLAWAKDWLEKNTAVVRKQGTLNEQECDLLLAYLRQGLRAKKFDDTRLLHGDIVPWNVLVKDGRITGIIDYGDLFIGPAAFEFARPYRVLDRQTTFAWLLEGYNDSVPEGDIVFCASLEALWSMPYHLGSDPQKAISDANFLRGVR